MNANTLSPTDFVKSLNEDKLTTTTKLDGIVKKAGNSQKSFMFSLMGCEGWVEIPTEAISNASVTGWQTCGDHKHATVSLEFAGTGGWAFELLKQLLVTRAAFNVEYKEPFPDATASCNSCMRTCRSQYPNDFFKFTECMARCGC